MLFLVDYENVGNAGMKGSSYLNAKDHIIVFYSETKKNMERRTLEIITASEYITLAVKNRQCLWLFG